MYKLFVAEAEAICWKCGGTFKAIVPVIKDCEQDRWFRMIMVFDMSRPLTEFFRKNFRGRYGPRWVKAYNRTAFVNQCLHCGITNGDKPLNSKPGSCFYPAYRDDGKRITLYDTWIDMEQIDMDGKLEEGGMNILVDEARLLSMSDLKAVQAPPCLACGSDRVERWETWLCYQFPVDVCKDCEWTARSSDRHVLYQGSMVMYPEPEHHPESFQNE